MPHPAPVLILNSLVLVFRRADVNLGGVALLSLLRLLGSGLSSRNSLQKSPDCGRVAAHLQIASAEWDGLGSM